MNVLLEGSALLWHKNQQEILLTPLLCSTVCFETQKSFVKISLFISLLECKHYHQYNNAYSIYFKFKSCSSFSPQFFSSMFKSLLTVCNPCLVEFSQFNPQFSSLFDVRETEEKKLFAEKREKFTPYHYVILLIGMNY